jgi:hypothetical protein
VIDVLRYVYERFELAVALLAFVLLDVGARDAKMSRAGARRASRSPSNLCSVRDRR